MEFLAALWMPILLSSVFVFIASSILHMVIPVHRGDYGKMPGEEKVLEAMRNHGVARGTYMFPCPASVKEMGTPETIEKYNQGPVGFLTVLPNGPPQMGSSLLQWFLYTVLVGIVTAYVAHQSLPAGAENAAVFRIVGAVALGIYGLANFTESIWKGVPWGITLKFLFDGAVYAAATGATFGWLWPAAS